ncbi:Lectin C-type domain [Paragonimus heterotremus]|uniref:Lectin C-type domain n=1 Tax=Paragonimus heterotremus TaxID=100268 RepID=A0A8J4WDB7_9TREM|nr:Lectin C-type domain [Paragonimus heterotremus]
MIVPVIVLLWICTSHIVGLQLSHKQISPLLTLTYVHGGEDAQMPHLKARKFCLDLVNYTNSQAENSTTGGKTTSVEKSPTQQTGSNPSMTTPTGYRRYSDLVSIHDPTMVHEIMRWILPLEKRQFWIGGLLGKVRETFHNRPVHLIHSWTDGTPANFRFLHFSNADMEGFREGTTKCLSVDFASGKWGAHECHIPMYFVCETIVFPDSPQPAATPTVTPSTVTAGSVTVKSM